MQAVWQIRLKEIAREYSQQRNKRLKDLKIPERKILGTFDRVLRIQNEFRDFFEIPHRWIG